MQCINLCCLIGLCPTGVDPLSVNMSPKEITWTITSTETDGFQGFIGLEYLGTEQFLSLSSKDPIACSIAFQAVTNLEYVTCTYSTFTTNLIQVIVTFSSGEPLASDFYCDVSTANAGVQCMFADVYASTTEGVLI